MAIVALVVSIVVAIAVIYREFVHDLVYKPEMEVTFSSEEPISCETIYEYLPSEGQKVFWPRLRIKNNGRVLARRCESILAEVRNPKGELIAKYDPLTLRWAITPIERGLQPLDIARGRVVYLKTFFTVEDWPTAFFATTMIGGPHEVIGSSVEPNECFEPGDYWLRIVIYGDNFQPVERGYAVHWDGKNYKKVGIKEMNEMPSDTSHWPWPIDKEPDKHLS